jgi:hypothetical protein
MWGLRSSWWWLWTLLSSGMWRIKSRISLLVFRRNVLPRSRIFLPWRWRRYVPPKHLFTQDLHGVTLQQAVYLSGFKYTHHVLPKSTNKASTTKKVYDKIRVPGRCVILLRGSDASVLVVTSGWCDWHYARYIQLPASVQSPFHKHGLSRCENSFSITSDMHLEGPRRSRQIFFIRFINAETAAIAQSV